MRKKVGAIIMIIMILLEGCEKAPSQIEILSEKSYEEQMEVAMTTPYGKYPELITYTLGKMTSSNNSNMPEGDTYEDNAYTRYIKSSINIQNNDIFEQNDTQYNTTVSMAMATRNLPDLMVVGNYDDLQRLVENDAIEDLTGSFNKCTSDKIKDIYSSYGSDLMNMVTFDGKIMAIPETNIDNGPNLVWLRKDWMDKLELAAPKTLKDVENIVREFVQKDPGNNGTGKTVGLACDTALSGEEGYSGEYLFDLVFSSFGAFPRQWIKDADGSIVYGSITQQAKSALGYMNSLYKEGILDKDFLLRTSTNIIELIEEGKCGSFFGPWWAPNNPLVKAVSQNPGADWQPYLIATDTDGSVSYHSQNPVYKYVVVRKGYEHPELAAKMVSIMFDKIRYQCDDSEAFIQYFQLNVDPTARPLAINVDYNNALAICYRELKSTIMSETEENKLMLLEDSYYKSCKAYLDNNQQATPDQWAAYVSRIQACSLITSDRVKKVQSLFFGNTTTMKTEWWKLKEKENQAYLKIICGEEPLTYFDTFVSSWLEEGGRQITDEVQKTVAGN